MTNTPRTAVDGVRIGRRLAPGLICGLNYTRISILERLISYTLKSSINRLDCVMNMPDILPRFEPNKKSGRNIVRTHIGEIKKEAAAYLKDPAAASFPRYPPAQDNSGMARGSPTVLPLMYSQMLTTNSHRRAKPRTAYAYGVSRPKATIRLAQPNQAGNKPVRKETTAAALIKTAMKIPNN